MNNKPGARSVSIKQIDSGCHTNTDNANEMVVQVLDCML